MSFSRRLVWSHNVFLATLVSAWQQTFLCLEDVLQMCSEYQFRVFQNLQFFVVQSAFQTVFLFEQLFISFLKVQLFVASRHNSVGNLLKKVIAPAFR